MLSKCPRRQVRAAVPSSQGTESILAAMKNELISSCRRQPTSFTRHFRFDALFIALLLIHALQSLHGCFRIFAERCWPKTQAAKSMSSRPVKEIGWMKICMRMRTPVLDPQVLSSAGFNEDTYKTISEKCKSRMKNDGTPTAADLVRHCKLDLLGLVFDVKKMQKALPRNVNFPSSISTNGHALRIYYHEYEVLKVTKEQQEEKKKVIAQYKQKLRKLARARGKKFKLDLKTLKKARKKNGAQDDSKEQKPKKEEDEKMEKEMDKADKEITKAKNACKKFEDSNLYLNLKDVTKIQRGYNYTCFRKTLKGFRAYLAHTTIRAVDPGCRAIVTVVDLFVQNVDVRETVRQKLRGAYYRAIGARSRSKKMKKLRAHVVPREYESGISKLGKARYDAEAIPLGQEGREEILKEARLKELRLIAQHWVPLREYASLRQVVNPVFSQADASSNILIMRRMS